jgi:hypothetical protein|tara:strand:+ start:306 stop:539 length:234 start_codon:yes stop_codon:yes gene_type:complete
MEENEKNIIYLKKCAQVAEILGNNQDIQKTVITFDIKSENFNRVLMEIEEFVKVRVDRTQKTISVNINEVEYIFNKI